MEYLLGSFITFATIVTVLVLIRILSKRNKVYGVQYSQSYVYELIKPLIPDNMSQEFYESQSTKHYDKIHTNVLVMKDVAYWIKDTGLYRAPIKDGLIDQESASIVDTMAMDKVQLDEVILIVEELTRGKGYDSRDSG